MRQAATGTDTHIMPSPELCLPEPTGHHPVGTTWLWLNDKSRSDPWVAAAATRELMVSLWYPAQPSSAPHAQYMTSRESELMLTDAGITDVPLDLLSTTRTHATRDADPVAGQHDAPLVILSPGYGKPRMTLTALAEDLASHGYVVAAVDHTYESVATTFPDGRVAADVRPREESALVRVE